MNLKNDKVELKIEKLFKESNYMTARYLVELISGEWPLDKDLRTICDNLDFSLHDRTFGGNVTRIGDKKKVEVYID